MSVRFQADADLNHIIVQATLRREPSVDFQTAQMVGLAGVPDQEVLALAAHEGKEGRAATLGGGCCRLLMMAVIL